ncbi:uncharacterized protein LOC127777325 isoform X3 [Oryza glaberrima]|uniref:uncharacterized protein LOC127777325 isoform X3 n=1 Tax=Oryza glaberrima TaxID=4538 RepID=UPI00224BF969|nr:uncharacterized protein LOC127777325 isoform X3 [Oryza glaberrima]
MESPAAGGASPAPEAPPPPPRGWISGLVSGAGRILASVLGPDSPAAASGSATTTSATSPSASSSPASSRHPGYIRDHGNSPLFFPKANKLNKSENEAIMKDYSEASLAIISEIEPKDAIMQLLKQETYSRSECNALVKIIQERVVDSNLNGVDAGGLALPINWKTGRQANIGYSSLSPKGLLPATSIPPVQDHVFDNSAGAGASTTIAHDRGPSAHATDKIQSVLKRSYSVAKDTPEDSRRVRPKINGNSLEISKFKQVDVIRTHSGDDNKLSDVPLFGTNNLIYSNIVSIVGSADEKIGIPNKPSAGDDNKNYDSEFLNPCTNKVKDLKNSFPLKVEPLDVCIPFEQQMMDLSHQKHEHAACDDSCSVSKLMFKEDIETALSLPVGVPLENGSKNRRRRAPNTQRITPARSPAKGSRRKNNDVTVKSETDLLEQSKGSHDVTVKSEIDLLEQSKLVLMEQSPDLGDIPVKRPVGRPRKAK